MRPAPPTRTRRLLNPPPAIPTEVYKSILEHEYCGEFDGGVEGDRVWMTCTCGAVINRNADLTHSFAHVAALVRLLAEQTCSTWLFSWPGRGL